MRRHALQRSTSTLRDPRTRDHLLTAHQTAAFLGLSPHTLAVWRCTPGKNHLPYCKLGKSVRYREADLVAFVERNLIPPIGRQS